MILTFINEIILKYTAEIEMKRRQDRKSLCMKRARKMQSASLVAVLPNCETTTPHQQGNNDDNCIENNKVLIKRWPLQPMNSKQLQMKYLGRTPIALINNKRGRGTNILARLLLLRRSFGTISTLP